MRYQYLQRIKERLRGFGMLRYEEVLDSEHLFGSSSRLACTGAAIYDASQRLRLEGGLGLYNTFNPDAPDLFEIRLWQAATLDWPDSLGKVRLYVFQNRLMIEERFKESTDWTFALRLRYRLSFSFAINRYTVEPGAFFIPLAAEFFFPLDEGAHGVISERNRFTLGLGYVLNKTWKFEARYTLQRQRASVDGQFQTADHIVEIRFSTAIRVRDLLKGR